MNERTLPNRQLALAIIAGGASTRMGRDKALLRYGGQTLLERTARLGLALDLPVLVCGRAAPADWSLPAVGFVPDSALGAGPLGGLIVALSQFPAVLAVAVDLPRLDAHALAWLLAAARAQPQAAAVAGTRDGRAEPLFACYRAAALPMANAHLARGEHALHRLLRALDAVLMPMPPDIAATLTNVNTPDDWAALEP